MRSCDMATAFTPKCAAVLRCISLEQHPIPGLLCVALDGKWEHQTLP